MAALEFAPGELIAGKYRVDHVLGSGGMGVVVAAWHCDLEQPVALKLILPEALENGEALQRFRREARATAGLRGPHIVRVMDVSTLDSGVPFMVMELLEGHDLDQELDQRGPLPIGEAVHYVLQVIDALAEAHAAGIIHRDLKPANVFLARQPDGTRRIKVLDFGVSKAGNVATTDLGLTRDYTLIGSPLYMSPEQMRSARDVDSRTDIWSLGVILFELLTGETPFNEASLVELFRVMMHRPTPSMRALRPEVPDELEQVVARCLHPHPIGRYPDVLELAHDLAPFDAPDSSERASPALLTSQRSLHTAPGSISTQPSARVDELVRFEQTLLEPTPHSPPGQRLRSSRRRALAGVALAAVAGLAGFAWFGSRWSRASFAPVPAHVVSVARASGYASLSAASASEANLEVPSVTPSAEPPSTSVMEKALVSSPPALTTSHARARIRASTPTHTTRSKPSSAAPAPSPPAPPTASDSVPDYGGRR